MKEDELSDVDRLVFLMEEIELLSLDFNQRTQVIYELLLMFSKKE